MVNARQAQVVRSRRLDHHTQQVASFDVGLLAYCIPARPGFVWQADNDHRVGFISLFGVGNVE